MFDQQTHVFLNSVAASRADDFERFVAEVVTPAVREQRADLVDRWRLLKASAPEPSDPPVVVYALVFDGGDVETDWDLERLLVSHYREEEAARLLDTWASMFVPLDRWMQGAGTASEESGQIGWTFDPVGLG